MRAGALLLVGIVLWAGFAGAETPLVGVTPEVTEDGGHVVTCLGVPLDAPATCLGTTATALGDATCPPGAPCVAASIAGDAQGDIALSLLGSTTGPIRLTERAEMADDGYMLRIERVGERVFDVHALAEMELFSVGGEPITLQYASVPVDILPAGAPVLFFQTLRAAAPCDSEPAMLPVQRCTLGQAAAVLAAPDGHAFLRVTLTDPPYDPYLLGAIGARVQVEGGAWVEGYYNIAKLALPLDALDAVSDPVRIA